MRPPAPEANSLTLPKHPLPGLPWPRGDPGPSQLPTGPGKSRHPTLHAMTRRVVVFLSFDCLPQPGIINPLQKLDILSYRQRVTYRLAHRNFGTDEAMVTNQSVEAQPGIAGVR